MSGVRVLVGGRDVTDRTRTAQQIQAENATPTSWIRPVDGDGAWEHTTPHQIGVRDVVIVLLACLIGGALFLAFLAVSSDLMCQIHTTPGDRPSYCEPETAR